MQEAFAQHARRDSLLSELEQHDLIDFGAKLLKIGDKGKVDRKKKIGTLLFSVIPIAPAESGEGKVAISAINASFYLSHESNLSSIYFYPYTNFKGSYGVTLTPNIWLEKNAWNLTGDFRLIQNVLRDYGLGSSAPKDQIGLVEYGQVRTYLTGYIKIKNYFYVGTGYNLDYFYDTRQASVDAPTSTRDNYNNYDKQPVNITSSGVTVNLLRDNRKNSVNPRGGLYANFNFRINQRDLASTTSWTSIYAEARKYFSFSQTRHKILAFRSLYWGTYGDVPYLNMPATFQDVNGRAGRGYSTNRFRGRSMAFFEAEYRFDISQTGFLGGTFFANMQSFAQSTGSLEAPAPAAGLGLRLKFNRNSDTNIAIDFGVGRDGLGVSVNLGEYF